MGNLLSRNTASAPSESSDPDDQPSANARSNNSILTSLLSSMEIAQQTLLLRHLNRRRALLASSANSTPSTQRRRPLEDAELPPATRLPPSPGSSASRMRLRPRLRAEDAVLIPSTAQPPSQTPLLTSPISPITVIVNILNHQAETPSLATIMHAVVQALSMRNPSTVRSWRHVPFLIVIRTSPSAIDQAQRGADLDLLMDSEGNLINSDSQTTPDYSIFVTDSSSGLGNGNTAEETIASMLWNALALSTDANGTSGTFEDLIQLQDLIGYGHPLISATDLGPPKTLSELALPPSECTICLETIKSDQGVRMLSCKHLFHADCVDKWLCEHRSSCPLCRMSVMREG